MTKAFNRNCSCQLVYTFSDFFSGLFRFEFVIIVSNQRLANSASGQRVHLASKNNTRKCDFGSILRARCIRFRASL